MEHWDTQLKQWLAGMTELVILGVGNNIRGDDGTGPYCADTLKKKINRANINIINTGEVIENYTGEIRNFNPTHVLIIDVAAGGFNPGTIFIVDKTRISDEDVSTHRMPLSMAIRFIEESIGSKVFMLGIEPESTEFNKPISNAVKQSADIVINTLISLLSGY